MALTLRRFFEPKATVLYPEVKADVPPKFRGRLQLLYDEYGTLKCETCFQCAQACPIECIDMGGMDTKGRFHVHWGAPETYGERREESALRRSGRTVPDQAYEHFAPFDIAPVDEILERFDHDPKHMLPILEATQAAFGFLPVAALKRISQSTGAWYATIYGTASYYGHLRFEPPANADRPAADRRPAAGRRGVSWRGSVPRSAARPGGDAVTARREPSPMAEVLPRSPAGWPPILPRGPAPGRPGGSRRRDEAGAFEGLRRAVRELGADGDDRRGQCERASAGAAARGIPAATSGGRRRGPTPARSVRRRQRLRRGPGDEHGPDPARAHPTRSSRAWPSPRSPSARGGRHRGPVRSTATVRIARGGDRGGDGSQLHRRDALGSGATSTSTFARSRARTCSARRRSCSRPSRASAASRSSARPIRRRAASAARRRSSRTSRPSPRALDPGERGRGVRGDRRA